VTVSAYQQNSWGEYMRTLLPAALDMAMADDVRFRQGLPLNFLSYMGVLHSDKVPGEDGDNLVGVGFGVLFCF
jgi:lysine-specific demethylase/histidyl-hydroxylase NO66